MTNFELINLTLDEIRRSAAIVESVRTQALYHKGISKDEVFSEMVKRSDDELNSIRLKLREILEDISNFRNKENMVDGLTVAITEIPYDLIYERKTEDDFE